PTTTTRAADPNAAMRVRGAMARRYRPPPPGGWALSDRQDDLAARVPGLAHLVRALDLAHREPRQLDVHLTARRQPGAPLGLLVAQAGGLLCDGPGGRGREFRVAAARGHSEHLVTLCQALGARLLHGARHVAAEHGGQLRLREAASLLPVDRVDRGGLYLDQ